MLENDLEFLGAELIYRDEDMVLIEYQGLPISFQYREGRACGGWHVLVLAWSLRNRQRALHVASTSSCLEFQTSVIAYVTGHAHKTLIGTPPLRVRRIKRLYSIWKNYPECRQS